MMAMLVYVFWFIKTEFHRTQDRLDQAVIGIARMNKELMQSTVKLLTDQIQTLPDFEDGFADEDGYDDDESLNEEIEEEEGEEVIGVEDLPEDDGDKSPEGQKVIGVVEEQPEAVNDQVEDTVEGADSVEAADDLSITTAPKKRGRKPKANA
jgi:hypothetical protein